MTQPLKIGIAGLGTVGAGVVKLLTEHGRLLALRGGRPLKLVAVSARSKAKKRDIDLSKVRWERDPMALATAPDIDVVIELIGGSGGVARKLVQTALRQGKTLSAAVESVFRKSKVAPEDRPLKVQTWFQTWSTLGWFCRPEKKREAR